MVSINSVYQTVLTLLNKEQRGYLTPTDFNLFANQAQIEIFESYFAEKAAVVSSGAMIDDDFADANRNLEEKITFFEQTSDPILEDADELFAYPTGFYRLGRVLFTFKSTATEVGKLINVDEVSHKDLTYIQLSNLTAPTRKQPIYTRHEGGINLYPATIGEFDQLRMVYVRRPSDVLWVGGVSPTGQSVPGPVVDFELHPSELPVLIVKILGYAGLHVKAQDVVQAASSAVQQQN